MPGDVAIFFFGVVARHYLWYSLSSRARQTTDLMYTTLKEIMETCVFVILGAQIFVFEWSDYNFKLIFSTFLACVVARATAVFSLSTIVNCFRSSENRFVGAMQIMMWFSGLRGAVAYSLAMTVRYEFQAASASIATNGITGNSTNSHGIPIPASDQVPDETLLFGYSDKSVSSAEVNQIITTSHTIIIATVLVFGLTAEPLLKCLKLTGEDFDHQSTIVKHTKLRVKPLEAFWRNFDRNYLVPVFSNPKNRIRKRVKSISGKKSTLEVEIPDEFTMHNLDLRSSVSITSLHSKKGVESV